MKNLEGLKSQKMKIEIKRISDEKNLEIVQVIFFEKIF